jgi:tripartite-type tricarboxylate transporter receptor subunit TctC
VKRNDKKKAPRGMTVDARKSADRQAGPRAGKIGHEPDEGMSPALQAHIGRHIRAMFDEVAEEPVPDHLLQLLKDLDQSGEK